MFIKPDENLKYLNLHGEMVLVDLGAGSGFYTISSAKMLPSGIVYAVDINSHFLKTINHKAHDLRLDNIRTIVGDLEVFHGSKLNDKIADRVIVSNIFFQLENKEIFLKEVFRILKDNGEVLFVDFHPTSQILGKLKNKILSKDQVVDLFLQNKFFINKEIFENEHNYAVIFNKNKVK